jgi:hypothetical protein
MMLALKGERATWLCTHCTSQPLMTAKAATLDQSAWLSVGGQPTWLAVVDTMHVAFSMAIAEHQLHCRHGMAGPD